jgi:hypothetical protein
VLVGRPLKVGLAGALGVGVSFGVISGVTRGRVVYSGDTVAVAAGAVPSGRIVAVGLAVATAVAVAVSVGRGGALGVLVAAVVGVAVATAAAELALTNFFDGASGGGVASDFILARARSASG